MKLSKLILLFLFITGCASGSFSQSSNQALTFIDKSFHKIISRDSKIEKIADGFQFTEGPVWHKDGYLLFSDIPANKIYKYEPGNGVSIYLENSGYIGSEDENKGAGSNGLTFDNSNDGSQCLKLAELEIIPPSPDNMEVRDSTVPMI